VKVGDEAMDVHAATVRQESRLLLMGADGMGARRLDQAILSKTTGSELAALQGVPLDTLPFIVTTDGGHRIRASYNGGLTVVRRTCGILGVWADRFSRSVAAGLRLWKNSRLNVQASTGLRNRHSVRES
jgi:hypothetical protein